MKKLSFSNFVAWLKSPGVFGNVSKRFPGEWNLYEYYVDVKDELIHLEKNELDSAGQACMLKFSEEGLFNCQSNIPISLFQSLEKGDWSRARNYITLMDPKEFRNNVEFQFAFEKGNLKLLKRDPSGKIAFFGFFKQKLSK